MKLSPFGEQLTGDSGIVSLMEDLGDALNVNPNILFLGGGNPAWIPAFEQRIAKHLKSICDDPDQLHKLLGVYQSPRGNEDFIQALTAYLRKRYDWPITERNLAVASGSQSAFFLLLNMLAGERKVCFPMMPEYLGYRDQGIAPGMYCGFRPQIEEIGEHRFKYHIDFDALEIDESIAALCVSRPTNPTGNVITDSEMQRLSDLAHERQIPLIVDCAYGLPFPGLIYQPVSHQWNDNTILALSLSKLGLPGVRTGIIVAPESITEKFVRANTIVSLANGNLGPALANALLRANELDAVCEQELQPFYRQKREFMLTELDRVLAGLNYRVHQSEGAFFVWLWFPELAMSSETLYQRLKAKNVLIMAGEHFFFGLGEPWPHSQQCIRLNFCQPGPAITQALEILAAEIRAS
ncbi:valine-pyruvate aminotransferase [Alteromonadaceae bacterium 2753L.S.0a.02]|nr:valine-pyruvate aminotransferase [Alteromonadaceae bacterium 2753L.S.0a.02]